ncbi:hypothetical protein SAMN05444920_14923 [Nonomuraea solani]|uniref:Uncharacterized protein n=1 Tax=Nonomuraea solani TaxID=1144553 RepID=A0A1H6F2W8_9ACTN|nr:hypothetical protein [Nonomuraea solani]SEH03953.1 hypothetical protein SAMN05444920_14923 [Nonomuraea solani]
MEDLSKPAATVRKFAEQAAMTLVPAIPDTDLGHEVRLGPDTLDLATFLDTARQHGGGLLYLQASPFAPADDENRVADAPAHLAKHTGQIGQMDVAFAANGIVHVWQDRTPWYAEWRELAAAEAMRATYARETYENEDDDELREQEQAQRAELVEALLANPSFRAAKGVAARRPIAEAIIQAADVDWPAWRAIRTACERAEELGREKYTHLNAQLDDLVPELAADLEFQRCRTVPARNQVTERFLVSRADGFSGPVYLRDELRARAQRSGKAGNGEAATGLF